MADDANTNGEPPLVLRGDELPPNGPPPLATLVEPKRLPKPRPGLIEAILWCLILEGTLIVSSMAIMVFVLFIFAIQTQDPSRFVIDQLKGLTDASSEDIPAGEKRPGIPAEIGQALAYGMLGSQFAALGVILLVFPWRVGRDWKRQIGVRCPTFLQVSLIVLLIPGFLFLTSGIEELLREKAGITLPNYAKTLNDIFIPFPWLLPFLAVGLGPGAVEELWCRGFLGRGLSARYGLLAGVTMTSIMFGLLHGSLSYAIPTAIMGAYLHFVYLASRSIWISMLLHTLNNSIALFLGLAGVEEQLDAAFQKSSYAIYLTSFALVLFASLALWISRPRTVPTDFLVLEEGETASWKPEYPGISAPPPNSGFQLKKGKTSPVALGLTLISFAILAALLIYG